MAGAIIQFTQARPSGPSVGTAGIARNDLWENQVITCASTLGGNTSWAWTFADLPPGSTATLTGASTATATFTPDLPGSYAVTLTTNGGGSSLNVQTLIAAVLYDVAGNLVGRGWRIPALGETSAQNNFLGQTRSWDAAYRTIITDLQTTLGTVTKVVQTGQYSVTLANGVNSNVNTNGHQSVIRVGGPTAAFSIDGFDHAPAAGEVITVINTTAFTMSAGTTTGSTAGQRVQVVGGTTAATQVRPGGAMQFTGDSTSSVWILTSLGHYRATEINVVDIGADPTGTNPSALAIQTAINFCRLNHSVGVYIPAGSYLLESPLWVTSEVRIRGDGVNFTYLTANSFWCGPIVAVGGNTVSPPTLVTSGSLSLLEMYTNGYIDLQKWNIFGMTAGASQLNGYTTFEIGCYLNPLSQTLAAFSESVVLSSSGVSDAGFNNALNFFIVGGTTGGNFVLVNVKTSTGALGVQSATTLPANTNTFVSFTYDGTSLKLYQNGVLVGTSTGSSGHMVVNPKENFILGMYGQEWPVGSLILNVINNFLIGELIFSAGYLIHSSAYTPPTGPLAQPTAGWLMSFTAANQSSLNSRWLSATFSYPGYANSKVWYLLEDGNIIQITNVHIKGLNLNGATGGGGSQLQCQTGMNINGTWFSTFEDLNINYTQHALIQNVNSVNNKFDSIFIGSFQGFGIYSIASFASEFNECNVATGYYAMMFQGSAHVVRNLRGTVIKRCFVYDTSPTGATLTSDFLNVVYDDETAGCLTECLLYFANKNSTRWSWGSVYMAPALNTPPQVVKLINCTNMVFENTLFGAPTGGPVFSFSQPDNYSGTSNGPNSHIPPRVTNQGSPAINTIWIDPANPGELILDGQETSGMTVLNFASDADMSIGFNDLLFHTIVLTDTAGVLTTGRNAKLPAQWLRERVVINRTAQTVTVLGPSTPAWASTTTYVAAPALNTPQFALGGANASIVTNAGNVYRCATAIASATTAPTTAIYGKVVTDGSGSWTAFGPISAPTISTGATIRIRSDGVQWWLS